MILEKCFQRLVSLSKKTQKLKVPYTHRKDFDRYVTHERHNFLTRLWWKIFIK